MNKRKKVLVLTLLICLGAFGFGFSWNNINDSISFLFTYCIIVWVYNSIVMAGEIERLKGEKNEYRRTQNIQRYF